MNILIALGIPFIGTTLGAAMVFFMKEKIAPKLEKALLGFASGVMIAASVWSLLIPSIDMTEAQGGIAWVPAVVGFLLGIAFLLLLDTLIPHLHLNSDKPEGVHTKISKTLMMLFAITLHNIPEGMAVGVTIAGALAGNAGITITGAFALSLGIAIQNFPEGRDCLYAVKGRRYGKTESISVWYGIRRSGAGVWISDNPACSADDEDSSVFPVFCSWCDDLCCCGGTDPGSTGGRAYEYRNDRDSDWLCVDDGARCGTWINVNIELVRIRSEIK